MGHNVQFETTTYTPSSGLVDLQSNDQIPHYMLYHAKFFVYASFNIQPLPDNVRLTVGSSSFH